MTPSLSFLTLFNELAYFEHSLLVVVVVLTVVVLVVRRTLVVVVVCTHAVVVVVWLGLRVVVVWPELHQSMEKMDAILCCDFTRNNYSFYFVRLIAGEHTSITSLYTFADYRVSFKTRRLLK